MKSYRDIGLEIGDLVTEKNAKYGDSFSKSPEILKILYPNGVTIDKYKDLLAVTRIIDKLFRIATDKKALGENPYSDITGYCILGLYEDQKEAV